MLVDIFSKLPAWQAGGHGLGRTGVGGARRSLTPSCRGRVWVEGWPHWEEMPLRAGLARHLAGFMVGGGGTSVGILLVGWAETPPQDIENAVVKSLFSCGAKACSYCVAHRLKFWWLVCCRSKNPGSMVSAGGTLWNRAVPKPRVEYGKRFDFQPGNRMAAGRK